jgi:hypothetical protein
MGDKMYSLLVFMFIYGANGIPTNNMIAASGTPIIVGTFQSQGDCEAAADAATGIRNEKGSAQVGIAFACVRSR